MEVQDVISVLKLLKLSFSSWSARVPLLYSKHTGVDDGLFSLSFNYSLLSH